MIKSFFSLIILRLSLAARTVFLHVNLTSIIMSKTLKLTCGYPALVRTVAYRA